MANKLIAVTGSTGGILSKLLLMLAKDNYDLLLINRNYKKSLEQKNEILKCYPNINIDIFTLDMNDFDDIKIKIYNLKKIKIDYLILGAAIYKEDIIINDLGYNNIFQVNFVSPYFIARELLDSNTDLKVIVISSVAYNYTNINKIDIPLNNEKRITHIYGNSKRFITFSLMKRYMNQNRVIITHPGVTYTKLTNHYPVFINWFIKLIIKIFLPSNKSSAKNIYYGLTHNTDYLYWIGPSFLGVYGKPKIKKMKITDNEINDIDFISNEIYQKLK